MSIFYLGDTMRKFLNGIFLRVKLFFAKKHLGIDVGNSYSVTSWCLCKFVDNMTFVVASGVGKPPKKHLNKSKYVVQ
jgi:hypothetical protein